MGRKVGVIIIIIIVIIIAVEGWVGLVELINGKKGWCHNLLMDSDGSGDTKKLLI